MKTRRGATSGFVQAVSRPLDKRCGLKPSPRVDGSLAGFRLHPASNGGCQVNKTSKIQVIGGIVCLAMALYFGLNATRRVPSDVYGNERAAVTDWGRVALTLVFGFAGVGALWAGMRKS